MLTNLKSFLVRDNVLALAVGIIIGGAFGKIVTTMVDKLIMPVIGIFLGGLNFKGLNLTIGNAVVGYGEVIQAVLDFIIIGIVLYFLLKAAGPTSSKAASTAPISAASKQGTLGMHPARSMRRMRTDRPPLFRSTALGRLTSWRPPAFRVGSSTPTSISGRAACRNFALPATASTCARLTIRERAMAQRPG